MRSAACKPREPSPSDRTLPARDVELPPPKQGRTVPTNEPPQLPPEKDIHPRRRLPLVPEGPEVSDPDPAPPVTIDDR